MKKNLVKSLVLLSIPILLIATTCEEPKKAVIIHNGNEITISVNALDKHMDHHDDCFVRWVW